MRKSWTIVLVTCALLTGCAGTPMVTPTKTTSNASAGAPLQGMVHGGQQPIVGAHVYLYAANTNGYGSGSKSVLEAAGNTTKDGNNNYYVTTVAGGTFSITSDYMCPDANSQVYLYSIGGNPGAGPNNAAGMMAALGTCNSLTSGTFIVVNEVSTIATAYAIAGYAVDATHVSSSGSTQAEASVTNAFASSTNLEVLSNGLVSPTTPAGNGVVPQREIYTLANILAGCINSTGPSSTQCATLFSNAMNGSNAPTDTATAAINIAHNPGANVAALWGLRSAVAPFEPTLDDQPNDFTIAITYSGNGLDGTGFAPEGIAVDGSGNVWIPNYLSSSISEFNTIGAVANNSPFTAAGLDQPTSIAIDIYGSGWAANFQGASISEFSSTGQKLSNPPGWIGGGLDDPYGICFDVAGHSWIANFGGNSVSEFSSSTSFGLAISGSNGFTDDSIVGPAGIASDTSGNVWTVNYTSANSSITEATPSVLPGQPPTFSSYTGAGLNSPYGIAIDGSGNIWATNRGGNGSISELSANGTAISPDPAGITGGGVDEPYGIAIDGVGNVWTANNGGNGNSVSEFNPSGAAITGSNGYVASGLVSPYGIAIDGSGNVWVASENTAGPLTEFVGAAAPVVTPISAGVAFQKLGTRP